MTLCCPLCRTPAVIDLSLADGRTMHCGECDEEFDLDQVRAFVGDMRVAIEGWLAMIPWVEACPARTTQPEGAAK